MTRGAVAGGPPGRVRAFLASSATGRARRPVIAAANPQPCNAVALHGKASPERFVDKRPGWTKPRSPNCMRILRRCFGAPRLKVPPNPNRPRRPTSGSASASSDRSSVDDEDGDRSFSFAMKVPVGRPVLQDYLRRLFGNDELTVAARLKKTDSVELNNGPEFPRRDFRRRAEGSRATRCKWRFSTSISTEI